MLTHTHDNLFLTVSLCLSSQSIIFCGIVWHLKNACRFRAFSLFCSLHSPALYGTFPNRIFHIQQQQQQLVLRTLPTVTRGRRPCWRYVASVSRGSGARRGSTRLAATDADCGLFAATWRIFRRDDEMPVGVSGAKLITYIRVDESS